VHTDLEKLSREEMAEKLFDAKLIDIDLGCGGKAVLFLTAKDGINYTIDCTGEKAHVMSLPTPEERLELLEDKIFALAELLGVDAEKLLEESYEKS
jgi:hypothetical protein